MAGFDLLMILSALLVAPRAQEVTDETNLTTSMCNINNSLTLKEFTIPECGSCRNKCGLWIEFAVCSCDSLCMYYDDCCPDIEYHCLETYKAASRHFQKYVIGLSGTAVCDYFQYTFTNIGFSVYDGYKIVTSCPIDTDACTVSPQKPESLIPVYDNTSKIHFVTADCAMCNGAYYLKQWKVSVVSAPGNSNRKSLVDIDGKDIFYSVLNGSIEGWSINIEPPHEKTSLRECLRYTNVRDNCPDECRSELIDKACKNVGSQPMSYRSYNYKNFYCVLCNMFDSSPIKCLGPDPRGRSPRFYERMFVVFDFSKSRIEIPKCAENQIWYLDKCRAREYRPLPKPYVIDLQNPNCSYIEFGPEEVNSTFNKSYIGLKPTRNVINKPYFYMGDNGSFFICLNQSYSTHTDSSENGHVQVFFILSSILLICSIIALTFRVILQCLIRELWQTAGWVQTSLAMAMLLSQIFLLTMPYIPPEVQELCISFATIMHWALLAMFCWMSVLSVDTCKMLLLSLKLQKIEQSKRCRFFAYSLIGWGLPLLVVILSVGLNYSEISVKYKSHYGAKKACWISQRFARILFFIVPVALSLLFNTIAFTISCIVLCKMSSGSRATGRKRYNTVLYLKLFLLMGLSWLTSIFAELADIKLLEYLSFLLNAAQGFLLVLGTMCTRSSRSAILAKCTSAPCKTEPSEGTSSVTATTPL